MFSLLAIIVTAVVLGSVLLWRAVRALSRLLLASRGSARLLQRAAVGHASLPAAGSARGRTGTSSTSRP